MSEVCCIFALGGGLNARTLGTQLYVENSVNLLLNKDGKIVLPKLLNWGMIYFILLMFFGQLFDWIGHGAWSFNNTANPYYRYYQNAGIKIIYLISFLQNTFLIALFYFQIKEISVNRTKAFINVILFVSTFLIWFELWYGSTFYYGEVRDKQGLPIGVNNLGILGSILFTSYFLLNLSFKNMSKTKTNVVKAILIPLNVVLQFIIVYLLEGPWNLWQS